ncbi:MAG: acyl-ACP--UDP-N-acetylglucosamine O-acyltransferase, partial [Rubripirellula sp.]
SFVGGMSRVLQDIPPFMLCDGNPARPRAANNVGLRRHDYSNDDIKALSSAYKLLYRSKIGIDNARTQLLSCGPIRPVLRHLFDFIDHTQGGRNGRGRDRRRSAA